MLTLGARRADQLEALLEPGDQAVQVVPRVARVLELVSQRGGIGQQRTHDAAVPQRALAAAHAEGQSHGSDSSPSSEAAKSEPITAPSAPAATRVKTQAARPPRTSSRDVEAKVLSAVISSNVPLSRGQIAERTGLTVGQLKHTLRRLVDDGRIVASGATVSRRYQGGEHQPHSEAGARTAAGRERGAAKMTDAVARVGLRDRVMKAVAADPCALDNNRLALALDADLDDVADACEFLVDKGRLQLHEDGTYLRSVAEAAREVAAA